MFERASSYALAALLLAGLAFGATLLHGIEAAARGEANRAASRELVQQLRLTDLALFTEARYTRHPAMADRHAPFQDHPMALEHFPSGALIGPPKHLSE